MFNSVRWWLSLMGCVLSWANHCMDILWNSATSLCMHILQEGPIRHWRFCRWLVSFSLLGNLAITITVPNDWIDFWAQCKMGDFLSHPGFSASTTLVEIVSLNTCSWSWLKRDLVQSSLQGSINQHLSPTLGSCTLDNYLLYYKQSALSVHFLLLIIPFYLYP